MSAHLLAFGVKGGRSNFSVSGTYLDPSPTEVLGENIKKLEKQNKTTKIKGIVSCVYKNGIERIDLMPQVTREGRK